MLVPLHEHGVQCPGKVIARADACGLHRRERVEHRARADRNAGGAQRTREVDDVLGETAARLRGVAHSIALLVIPGHAEGVSPESITASGAISRGSWLWIPDSLSS